MKNPCSYGLDGLLGRCARRCLESALIPRQPRRQMHTGSRSRMALRIQDATVNGNLGLGRGYSSLKPRGGVSPTCRRSQTWANLKRRESGSIGVLASVG